MTGNLRARLPRRDGGGMAVYDRLPPALRRWLAQAALPWSLAQALRIWRRHGGDPARAVPALARAEQVTLQREIVRNLSGATGVSRHAHAPAPPRHTPPPPA